MSATLGLGALALVVGGCAPAACGAIEGPAPVVAPQLYSNHQGDMGEGPGAWSKPPCPAGDVVVWADEPTTCDLDGSNVLVILGLPNEAACDEYGGRWVYEACEDADK